MKSFLGIILVALIATLNLSYADSVQYLKTVEDSTVIEDTNSRKIEVIFYRVGGVKEYIPTVKVNTRVVGSLMPDTYAKTYVCSHDFQIGVAQRGDSRNVTKHKPNIKRDQNIVFVKVIESNAHKFSLVQTDDNTAKEEISKFKMRSNIINRHVPKCSPSKGLKAHWILFDTDSSVIMPYEIKKIEKHLTQYNIKAVKRITLRAYTDARASKEYNMGLAKRRGESVKKLLRSKNPNIVFDLEVIGQTNKYSNNDCRLATQAEIDECLKENRRVELLIHTK